MYESFYGLHSKPFQLNPDPGFYFASVQHKRAKAYLDYGVLRNEGFIVVTGEIGAGKTTVVRGLLDSLESSQVVAAQLVSTQLGGEDVLRMIAAAFGVHTREYSKSELLMALEVFFVSQAGRGKRCLLVVDEAQNLSINALEELRMLSNFQFGNQALLQSFLVGQPEFRKTLHQKNMQQLRQRVIAACHIGPLDAKETKQYIEHRLTCAGSENQEIIDFDCYKLIHETSKGIPRRINSFCDRLLLSGFLCQKNKLSLADAQEVERGMSEELISDESEEFMDQIKENNYVRVGNFENEDSLVYKKQINQDEQEKNNLEKIDFLEKKLLKLEQTNNAIFNILEKLSEKPSFNNQKKT